MTALCCLSWLPGLGLGVVKFLEADEGFLTVRLSVMRAVVVVVVVSSPLGRKRLADGTFSLESESDLRFDGTEEEGVRWVRLEKKVDSLERGGLW